MKAAILADGFDTCLIEETASRPKPMAKIGGRSIRWHIMKIYLDDEIKEFVIRCGDKGNMIKEYFYNHSLPASEVTANLGKQTVDLRRAEYDHRRITLVDNGEEALAGGRLRQ